MRRAGAVGVLVRNPRDDVVPPSTVGVRPGSLPCFVISQGDGNALARLLRANASVAITFAASRLAHNDLLAALSPQ